MKRAYQVGEEQQRTANIIQHAKKESIRLNKHISNSGHCSRREADRLIQEGLVTIDGKRAEMGSKVFPHQEVHIEGKKIEQRTQFVYIALNKPIGVTCTTDKKDATNIVDYINHERSIFPIGRLDKDTSGLILMSDDGDIVNKILRSHHGHEKEYVVEVDHRITASFLKEMKKGVKIYNAVTNKYQITKPCQIKQVGDFSFHLILSEGMNRQIRRMCTALGYKVTKLKRIRIMNIQLDDLKIGTWRYLSEAELSELNEMLHK